MTESNEKLIILWKERILYISNLENNIIKRNIKYNETLKKWINLQEKIEAELLYRFSINRYNKSTFN